MTDFTQALPTETLAEILEHASVLDLLRFKQVNRKFREVIKGSPLIRHRIDLFSTGLEYNAEAGVSLDDSRQALLRYRSNLDSFCPTEKRTVGGMTWDSCRTGSKKIVEGICAIVWGGSTRLLSLGSPSPGMSHKDWTIPVPSHDLWNSFYCFCPRADVIAFGTIARVAE